MTPSPKELSERVGISPSYASMILSGYRDPPRSLAIYIFRKSGWRHKMLSDLTDEQVDLLEQVDPWTPKEAA